MTREKEQKPNDLGPPWTVLKLLRWTTGYFDDKGVTDTPRLDADLLLGKALGMDRVQLYARFDTEVDDRDRKKFRSLVKRRAGGEPVAYLVGHREFWQLDLETDDRALIPRPETEVVIELALEKISDREGPLRIADIGTGTGAIGLALAQELPDSRIVATDKNRDCLELARTNAKKHDLADRIDFFAGDLFEALPEQLGALDLIVSNPPYVPEDDREDVTIEVRDYEPDEALFAGPDGLDILERLAPAAPDWLADRGWLIVEIGHDQGDAVSELFEEAGFDNIAVRQDYSGNDRVAHGQINNASG